MAGKQLRNIRSKHRGRTSQYVLYRELVQRMRLSHETINDFAEASGVSTTTIRNWLYGNTMTPRIDTLSKVSESMGMKMILVPRDEQ